MDKHTMRAFEKLQKQEHFLRMLRDRLDRGIITQEVYEKELADIYERYQLSEREKSAYRKHIRMFRKSN